MQRNLLHTEVRRKSFCRKFGTLLESKEHQRKFFDDLAKKLNITNPEEWYQVTKSDALQLGAASILPLYANSLPKALAAIYPEIKWDEIKFSIRKPKEFWKDGANQKKFFDDLAKELQLKTWEVNYQLFLSFITRIGTILEPEILLIVEVLGFSNMYLEVLL